MDVALSRSRNPVFSAHERERGRRLERRWGRFICVALTNRVNFGTTASTSAAASAAATAYRLSPLMDIMMEGDGGGLVGGGEEAKVSNSSHVKRM